MPVNPCDRCHRTVSKECNEQYKENSPPCARNTASCQSCPLNILTESISKFNLKKVSDKNLIVLERLVEEEQQERKKRRTKTTKFSFIQKMK